MAQFESGLVALAIRARPDLAAHQRVVRMDGRQVVGQLVDLLGARLVAYLGGVSETRAVREWLEGKREMRADAHARLSEVSRWPLPSPAGKSRGQSRPGFRASTLS